jgi:hypothetical protein
LRCALLERFPACRGKEVAFAGQAVDSDRELRIAKFYLIVGVFCRPYIDSEWDGSDENEDCDESLHGETPLLVIFAPGLAAFFSGYHTLRT